MRVRPIVLAEPAAAPARLVPAVAAATALPPPVQPAPPKPAAPTAAATTSVATEPTPAEAAMADSPPGDATAALPPVYATRAPAAATLRYETRRNQRIGSAELTWQPGADGWRLALAGTGVGMASQGGFDAAGLAPLRHVELRRGREARAANFQRDSGRITFSGPSVEHPLLPGTQDRLSWLVQLPAVLNADAALAEPGTELRLAVAGVRGDAEVWVFTVLPPSDLELPAGPVRGAVHLKREPRRAWDTEVQVWLDPAREHLPVQLWLRLRANGEGTEFRLAEASAP
jgi:Protein of unknown function (DUF3108)